MSGFGIFTHAEYAQRLANVKARMERAGFDLTICQDPANMCWLTGYDGWSFYVERTASLRPGDTTELQSGMCFHFMAGVWLDDFGISISESFVVTEHGGERLCDVTRDLIVID